MQEKIYDDGDIIRYYKNVFSKEKRSRKRKYIDPRDYMIALLHYKFGYTEEIIASIFGPIDRSTINHAKRNPYYALIYNDATFLKNTKEVQEKFPYVFPEPSLVKGYPGRKYAIAVKLTPRDYDILKTIASARGQRIDDTARRLLLKQIRLFELQYLKDG